MANSWYLTPTNIRSCRRSNFISIFRLLFQDSPYGISLQAIFPVCFIPRSGNSNHWEENFAKRRKVSFYAAALNIHPAHLNSLVEKHLGINEKRTIDLRLLREVQSLLATPDYSIKELAGRLGFPDANYFTSFFKRLANASPTEYLLRLG